MILLLLISQNGMILLPSIRESIEWSSCALSENVDVLLVVGGGGWGEGAGPGVGIIYLFCQLAHKMSSP